MMLVQSSAIAQILTGRDSGWAAQARDADRVPWPLLWRFHRRHMLAGASSSPSTAGAISWRLLAWMSPALLGLVLAVPLSAFMGSARAGRRLARLGLLVTPEERRPPPLAAAAERARPRRCAPAPPRPRTWRASSPIPRRWRATSPGSTRRPPGAPASPTPRSPTRSSSSPTASARTRSTRARPSP